MATGTVKKLVRERGFGFIQGSDGVDLFFHRSALSTEVFDTLVEGQAVDGGVITVALDHVFGGALIIDEQRAEGVLPEEDALDGQVPENGLGDVDGGEGALVRELAVEGLRLGEAVGVALGQHQVGVVEEPVDGRGGEGLGHDRVESRRVDVAGHRDRPPFVGGVGDPVERLGGVLPGGQSSSGYS